MMLSILRLNVLMMKLFLNIKPDLVEGEDNLGNKINKRMVGIKLGAYNDQINHVKLGPAQSILHAFNEVYYVSVSSLKIHRWNDCW